MHKLLFLAIFPFSLFVNTVNASDKINVNFLGSWGTSKEACKGTSDRDIDSKIIIKPKNIEIVGYENHVNIIVDNVTFNEPNLIAGTGYSTWSSEGEEGSEYTSFSYLKRNGVIFDLNFNQTKYIKCS